MSALTNIRKSTHHVPIHGSCVVTEHQEPMPAMSGPPGAQRPHPNNPAEYCSQVPPTQAPGAAAQPPPSVLVPVLKRDGKLSNLLCTVLWLINVSTEHLKMASNALTNAGKYVLSNVACACSL